MKSFSQYIAESVGLQMPDSIAYLTPDEVAETLEVSDNTYRELWQIIGKAEKGELKPLGGDRTDYESGVSETPPEPDVGLRMGSRGYFGSPAKSGAWDMLSDAAKQDIIAAAIKYNQEMKNSFGGKLPWEND